MVAKEPKSWTGSAWVPIKKIHSWDGHRWVPIHKAWAWAGSGGWVQIFPPDGPTSPATRTITLNGNKLDDHRWSFVTAAYRARLTHVTLLVTFAAGSASHTGSVSGYPSGGHLTQINQADGSTKGYTMPLSKFTHDTHGAVFAGPDRPSRVRLRITYRL